LDSDPFVLVAGFSSGQANGYYIGGKKGGNLKDHLSSLSPTNDILKFEVSIWCIESFAVDHPSTYALTKVFEQLLSDGKRKDVILRSSDGIDIGAHKVSAPNSSALCCYVLTWFR
jgi:hypothetical protein